MSLNLQGKELIEKYEDFRLNLLKISVSLSNENKELNRLLIDTDNKIMNLRTMVGELINDELKKIKEDKISTSDY
jgi:hypothetical protein